VPPCQPHTSSVAATTAAAAESRERRELGDAPTADAFNLNTNTSKYYTATTTEAITSCSYANAPPSAWMQREPPQVAVYVSIYLSIFYLSIYAYMHIYIHMHIHIYICIHCYIYICI